MAERQTGSDRFPELGAFVSNHKGLITFDAETERGARQRSVVKRQKEPQSLDKLWGTDDRLELDLD